MSIVSRSDVFVRDERGGEWFDEFLRSMAEKNPSTVQEVMNIITDKKGQTVESVVQSYREQVGLDALSQEDTGGEQVKKAHFRPLSIRHAKMGPAESSLPKLKGNPEIMKDIDSMCEHSGGTKNTLSIMNFLRDRYGKELVSFSDQELRDYIEQRKKRFYNESDEVYDVGLVGQERHEDFEDDIADYQTHDGVKR